jgi:hypothetical protein
MSLCRDQARKVSRVTHAVTGRKKKLDLKLQGEVRRGCPSFISSARRGQKKQGRRRVVSKVERRGGGWFASTLARAPFHASL